MEEETNREEELRIQVELQTPSPGVQPVEEEETDENLAKLSEEEEKDKEKWDYVLLFGNVKPPRDREGNQLSEEHSKMRKFREMKRRRKELIQHLLNPELRLTAKKVKVAKSTYVLLTAPEARYEEAAEEMELKVSLKSGGYTEYVGADKLFYNPDNKDQFFSRMQKMSMLVHILEARREDGGAGLNLRKLVKDQVITKFYGLHENEERYWLLKNWGSFRNLFSYQPIDRVRSYFGEEIAMYFAWLGFYTTTLWWASLPGLITFIIFLVRYHENDVSIFTSANRAGDWSQVVYSVYLALWASLFIEFWKRQSFRLAFRWGTDEYEETETVRPEFNGENKMGVYHEGEWVDWYTVFPDWDQLPASTQLTAKHTLYSPHTKKQMKIGLGIPLAVTFMMCVVIATLSVLSLRLFIQGRPGGKPWDGIVGGALNAIVIMIMNMIAVTLTDWENHRTQTEYNDNMIFKVFMFQFVNSYSCLYYIAFFKKNSMLWGAEDLKDHCAYGFSAAPAFGCVDDLTVQLAMMLVTNTFVNQCKELVIPWISKTLKQKKSKKQLEHDAKIPRYVKEASLSDWVGTNDEYSEMSNSTKINDNQRLSFILVELPLYNVCLTHAVIQYGYITLFAAALPIAPFVGLINNLLEIRTDAYRCLQDFNRPHYRGAQDIGTWLYILEVLGVIAVITNCLLIGFSYGAIHNLVNDNFYVLIIIVVLEHVLLFLKFSIAALIPDIPGDVRKAKAAQAIKQEYERKHTKTQ